MRNVGTSALESRCFQDVRLSTALTMSNTDGFAGGSLILRACLIHYLVQAHGERVDIGITVDRSQIRLSKRYCDDHPHLHSRTNPENLCDSL